MKILLVDKNLVDSISYKKWNILSKKKNVELLGVAPEHWMENYRSIDFSPNPSANFKVVSLPVFWAGYENRGFYLRGLRDLVKKFRPDILLLFEEPWSVFAFQGTWLRNLYASNAKIVFHTWDNLSKGWRYPYRPRIFYSSVEKFALKNAHLLVATNQESADDFSNRYQVRTRKIYYGVDLEAYRQQPSSKRRRKTIIVGYFGRLLYAKGVDTIIHAIKKCWISVELLVVGEGPEKARLQALAQSLGISEHVRFVNGVDSDKLPRFYHDVDIFVLASRSTATWKEQYGRVLIEAMAAGVPVIGSSSGAIPEVIGDAGKVFPEGDVEALAREIANLGQDAQLRKKLSQKGQKRAERFSAEQFADAMYSSLCEICYE